MTTNQPPEQQPVQPRTSAPVEWQLVEQVPGDPFSAELVVWSGDAIDGVVVPLDEDLISAVAQVRRRRADVEAVYDGEPLPDAPTDAEDSESSRARAAEWLHGIGRTTGSAQADRWLSHVPVRWQIIGAAALLVVFALVFIIGNLLR